VDEPGLVLAAPDRTRAVYLTPAEADTLHDAVKAATDRPTVAGPPPDLAAWERLGRALSLVHEPLRERPDPVVLSDGERDAFDHVRRQLAIRGALPLRVRHTCVDCGRERIVNPARPKPTPPPSGRSGPSGAVVAESAQLFSEGHPFLAALSFLGGMGGGDSAAKEAGDDACDRCDGDRFDSEVITFCPGCRAIRAESILLSCPDCGFDFGTRAGAADVWTDLAGASAKMALARTVAGLIDQVGTFENGLWPGQQAALIEALGPEDELLAMCRCALPGQMGRYVALLITDRQLVWSRQSAVSGTTGGSLQWTDATAVREYGKDLPATERGVEIVPASGPSLVFKDFRGTGVSLDGQRRTFMAPDLYQLALDRFLAHGGVLPPAPPVRATAAIPPPQPSPAPAPPPVPPPGFPPPAAPVAQAPGWYPDPWRAAALRWWDGRQWTSHVR
jgi:hypothetical protein